MTKSIHITTFHLICLADDKGHEGSSVDAHCPAVANMARRARRTYGILSPMKIPLATACPSILRRRASTSPKGWVAACGISLSGEKVWAASTVSPQLKPRSTPTPGSRCPGSLACQAESFGADAIIYDQMGAQRPFECWGRGHGHPTPWSAHAEERPAFLRGITDEIRKRNPSFSVFTEGVYDAILDSIGFSHSWTPGTFKKDALNVAARTCWTGRFRRGKTTAP